MYVSGSIGMDKEGQLVPGGIKEQTRQALENVKAILSTGGCQLGNVVKTTVLLSDIKHYAEFNSIYSEYFPHKPPARAAYQVAALPKNALVEIEAIAVIGDIIDE
jgi:reactive intermediate/imine deaminase